MAARPSEEVVKVALCALCIACRLFDPLACIGTAKATSHTQGKPVFLRLSALSHINNSRWPAAFFTQKSKIGFVLLP